MNLNKLFQSILVILISTSYIQSQTAERTNPLYEVIPEEVRSFYFDTEVNKVASSSQKLDSVIYKEINGNTWFPTYEYFYTYYLSGELEEYTYKYYSVGNPQPYGNQRTKYLNYSNGKPAIYIYSQLDPTYTQWQEYYKWEITQGASSQIAETRTYTKTSSTWTNNELRLFYYDSSNRLDSSHYNSWDSIQGAFLPTLARKFTYFSNGDFNKRIDYNFSNGQYSPFVKEEYFRDALGNDTARVFSDYCLVSGSYSWCPTSKWTWDYDASGNVTIERTLNFISNKWINQRKLEYLYGGTNLVSTEFQYSNWDTVSSDWGNAYRNEYTYNAQANLEDEIFSVWSKPTNLWEIRFKSSIRYDSLNNYFTEIDSSFIQTSGSYELSGKADMTYDYNFDKSDLVLPLNRYNVHLTELIWNNMPVLFNYQSYNGVSFDPYFKTEFYHSRLSGISIDENSLKANLIYPNPSNSYIKFNLNSHDSKVEIYSLSGKKLLDKHIETEEEISIEHLPQGTYIYRITQDNETYLGKLIKI